eukprot:Filipodium_phascolosomae@DN6989_c0_g1_i1.p1
MPLGFLRKGKSTTNVSAGKAASPMGSKKSLPKKNNLEASISEVVAESSNVNGNSEVQNRFSQPVTPSFKYPDLSDIAVPAVPATLVNSTPALPVNLTDTTAQDRSNGCNDLYHNIENSNASNSVAHATTTEPAACGSLKIGLNNKDVAKRLKGGRIKQQLLRIQQRKVKVEEEYMQSYQQLASADVQTGRVSDMYNEVAAGELKKLEDDLKLEEENAAALLSGVHPPLQAKSQTHSGVDTNKFAQQLEEFQLRELQVELEFGSDIYDKHLNSGSEGGICSLGDTSLSAEDKFARSEESCPENSSDATTKYNSNQDSNNLADRLAKLLS